MKILALITVVALAVFALFPGIDLYVSELFYDEARGGFFLRENWWPTLVYFGIRVLSVIMVGTCLFCVGLHLLKRMFGIRLPAWVPGQRALLYVLAVVILAPGLIVHQGFKEIWDRARPVNITEFGGVKTYTDMFVISDQDGKSFVSGHSAMGFSVIALALLYQGRRRKQAYALALMFGFFAAAGRVIQGAHYISDVTFGALVTLWTAHLLYRVFFPKEKSETVKDS